MPSVEFEPTTSCIRGKRLTARPQGPHGRERTTPRLKAVHTLPLAAGRTELNLSYFNFLCISTNIAMEFPAISFACCVCMNINCDCAYAHMKNYAACALQCACCGLRHTLPQAAAQPQFCTGRSTQIAARRPQGFLCVLTRNCIYVHTHAARK